MITQGQAERLIQNIRELEIEVARMEKQTLANRQHVNQLTADLKSLDEEKKRLGTVAVDERDEGDKVRRVVGIDRSLPMLK